MRLRKAEQLGGMTCRTEDSAAQRTRKCQHILHFTGRNLSGGEETRVDFPRRVSHYLEKGTDALEDGRHQTSTFDGEEEKKKIVGQEGFLTYARTIRPGEKSAPSKSLSLAVSYEDQAEDDIERGAKGDRQVYRAHEDAAGSGGTEQKAIMTKRERSRSQKYQLRR